MNGDLCEWCSNFLKELSFGSFPAVLEMTHVKFIGCLLSGLLIADEYS